MDILAEAMAETILLAWENISIAGEKLEYSTKNAKMVLTEYREFSDLISSLSMEKDSYRPDVTAKK
jgi:hypothetical protein